MNLNIGTVAGCPHTANSCELVTLPQGDDTLRQGFHFRRLVRWPIVVIALFAFIGSASAEITYVFHLDASNIERKMTLEGLTVQFPSCSQVPRYQLPLLPAEPIRLIIPERFRPTGLKIETSPLQQLASDYELAIWDPPEGELYRENPQLVSISPDSLFPGVVAEITNYGWLMDVKVLDMMIHPLQYTPATKKLGLVSDIRVTILGEMDDPPHPFRRTSAASMQKNVRYLRSIVKNPDAFSDFYQTPTLVSSQEIDALMTGGRPADDHSPLEYFEYVIVTSEALVEEFVPLRDSKTRRGIPARIVTVESILHDFPQASDDAVAVRSFLNHAYRNCGLQWALLGGDVEVVPSRIIQVSRAFGTAPTDLYFSCLDGDWNSNGDGELADQKWRWLDRDHPDLYPELYVGRAPVRNREEARTFVRKTLDYQENFESNTWRNKALFLGTGLFSPGDADHTAEWFSENIPATMTQRILTQTTGLTPQTAVDAINEGYSIVIISGHANPYSITCGSLITGLMREDFLGLTNRQMCGLMLAISCSPMDFSTDCIAEAWLRSPDGGGVGFIGWTTVVKTIFAGLMSDRVLELLRRGQVYGMGELMTKARFAMSESSGMYFLSDYVFCGLLGDPEAYIWTAAPRELHVSHPDHYTAGEQNQTALTISGEQDDATPKFLSLSITTPGDFYYSASSDSDGILSDGLFQPDSIGEATLTVSAPGYLPYSAKIPVVAGEVNPTITHYQFLDREHHPIDNMTVTAGDSYSLTVTLFNSSVTELNGLSGQVTSLSPFVDVVRGHSQYLPLSGNSSGINTDLYLFHIADNAPDSALANLQFVCLSGSEMIRTDTVSLLVSAPDLGLQCILYDDEELGDGDRVYDQNEAANLSFILVNHGSGRSLGLTGRLITSDDRVVILGNSVVFPEIAGRSEVESIPCMFEFSSRFSVAPIDLLLTFVDAHGVETLFPVRIPMRQPELNHSLEQKNFGRNSLELVWDPPDQPIKGYNLFKRSPSGAFRRTNQFLIDGGSRFVDRNFNGEEINQYFVSVVDTDGYDYPYTNKLIANNPRTTRDGFPIAIGPTNSMGTIAFDLDCNGQKEVYMCGENGKIYEVTTSGLIDSLQVVLDGTAIRLTSPVAGNVDGDPRLELVVGVSCEFSSSLQIYESFSSNEMPRLEYLIQMSAGHTLSAAPTIVDLNGDDRMEIAIASYSGSSQSQIHLFRLTDEGDWIECSEGGWPVIVGSGYCICTPAVGSASDGKDYLFYTTGSSANSQGQSLCGRGFLAEDFWQARINNKSGSTSIGDINGDGRQEVLLQVFRAFEDEGGDHVIYVLDATTGTPIPGWTSLDPRDGTLIGKVLHNPYGLAAYDIYALRPVIADFNRDGQMEVVIATEDSIYQFDGSGNAVLNWPQPRNNDVDLNWCGTPLIADVDGDASADIIMANGCKEIEAWDGINGTLLAGWPIHIGEQIREMVVDDIDGNRDLELVVTTAAGVFYLFDLGRSTGEVVPGGWFPDLSNGGNDEKVDESTELFNAYGRWSDIEHPYIILNNLMINSGATLNLLPGQILQFAGQKHIISTEGELNAIGNFTKPIKFEPLTLESWGGIFMDGNSSSSSSRLENCRITNSDVGIHIVSSVSNSSPLIIDSCTFIDNGISIYSNNAALHVRNSLIEPPSNPLNPNPQIVLVNCDPGMVSMDRVMLEKSSATTKEIPGLLLVHSSPKLTGCSIANQAGPGIACLGSTPDLSAASSNLTIPNWIFHNYQHRASGGFAAQILLFSSSYPHIECNNMPKSPTRSGYHEFLIFKDEVTNRFELDAINNWWGEGGANLTDFYWGRGDPIHYSPFSIHPIPDSTRRQSELSAEDSSDYMIGMTAWESGNYSEAIFHLKVAALEGGANGIRAVHYLSGASRLIQANVAERDSLYVDLREFLQSLAGAVSEGEVNWTARRFASYCLTKNNFFDEALLEFLTLRQSAGSTTDSLLAVADFITTAELASSSDAPFHDVPHELCQLFSNPDLNSTNDNRHIPTDCYLEKPYPNPFNDVVRLTYGLAESGMVRVSVFDISGREVVRLVERFQVAGVHSSFWKAGASPSGIYTVVLETTGRAMAVKVVLIK